MPRQLFTRLQPFTVFATVLVLYLAWQRNAGLEKWETAAGDALAQYGRKAAADPNLVFLAIDDASMLDQELDLPDMISGLPLNAPEAEALRLMSNRWPWPRSVYARALDRVFAAGARLVVFDLMFPTPSPYDEEFRAALDRHRDRVILASNFVEGARRAGEPEVMSFTRPSETLLPAEQTLTHAPGYTNVWPGADGAVRDVLFSTTRSAIYGFPPEPGEETLCALSARVLQKLGRDDLVPQDGRPHRIRLAGGAGEGFAPNSIYSLFYPKTWQANWRSGEALRDAIVVIGAAGAWQHDEHLTALGMMPGPEIHLNAINALLHGELIHAPADSTYLLSILAAGAVVWLIGRLVSPVYRILLLAALGGAWWGVALLCYNRGGALLPLVAPLLTLGLAGFLSLVFDLIATRRERGRLRHTLERYVSRNVVRELIENPRTFTSSLGGVVKPVTVLFSDVRNFTRLCANTEARELVDMLNEYLTAMVECAFRHRGTLDKFIGDAVMVVWGNATEDGPAADARQAVACALDMREELEKLNRRWEAEGRLPIRIGIALNHGQAVVGNIGSPHRMEFTVIGDAVNVCWRLQERTKVHGDALLLGEAMLPLLGPEYTCTPLDEIVVGDTIPARYAQLVAAPGWQLAATPLQPAPMAEAPELCAEPATLAMA